jgi:hypothetical protein
MLRTMSKSPAAGSWDGKSLLGDGGTLTLDPLLAGGTVRINQSYLRCSWALSF